MNRLAKLGESIRAARLPGVKPDGWWIAALAAESALPAITVWLTRRIASVWNSPDDTVGWVACLAAAVASAELLRIARGWLGSRQSAMIRDAVTEAVHAKSACVDLSFHDDAAFHENLHVARVQAPDQAVALVEGLGSIAQSLIALALLGAMVASVSPWLPMVIALAMLPLLGVRLRGAIRLHAWRRRNQDSERRAWYNDYLLTCAEPAPELRLLGWGGRVRTRFRDLRTELREGESAIHGRNAVEQAAALLLAALACAASWPLLWGTATALPEVLAAAQACYYGFSLTQPLIASIGIVYSALLTLGGFGEFLRLPETPAGEPAPVAPLRDGIRFRGVRFAYASSDRPVLDGLDLFLPAGEITAIVGANGSGKSTIAKLLCGLYRPAEGAIEFDGEPGPAPGMVSAMFQQPVRYQDTFAFNIAPAETAPVRGRLLAAAHRAGLDSKLDTWSDPASRLLGNQFPHGTELSGGEWQKVALARALHRESPVLVLDEPTSMMDPRAEAEFLATLRRHVGGRTIVIITHRRAAAESADRILEMGAGSAKNLSRVN